jgi:transcription antitermination factor NusG
VSKLSSKSPTCSWFVVHGKTNRERSIGNALAATGFEVFLPLGQIKRQWSDRIKRSTIPLFPGYIFCRLDIRDKLTVLKTPGVISIVGRGKEPVPLADDEVCNVRIMVDSGLCAYPWPYVIAGRPIEICEGPLRGLRAIVLEEDATTRRLIVSVELLNRSVAVGIVPEWVMSLEPNSSDFKLAGSTRAA